MTKRTLLFTLAAALAVAAQTHSWQKQHARATPEGGLEWTPEPFAFQPGTDPRYIDFDAGDDTLDGLTTATAWKRHPLDPTFTGNKPAALQADTFIFKRGVLYRGALIGALEGTAQRPVILTSDPSWGTGEAVLTGSEEVTHWTLGANHPSIPDAHLVWHADLDFAPRGVWAVYPNGETRRIPLAREPNWTVTDPEDVMSNWYEWTQWAWWEYDQNKTTVNNVFMHLGVDTQRLANRNASDLVGGIVWTEWGIVMGTPFPTLIEAYEPGRAGVAFQGFWGGASETIITANRYFMEDRPNFLDDPVNGEYWFDKQGDGGRLYLRLPNDADPATVRVEAAKRINLVAATRLRHARISGLSFRFTNVRWPLTERGFVHEDVRPAAVRCIGPAENAVVANCVFEHVNKAVRIDAAGVLAGVTIRDNDILHTDHGAIELSGSPRWEPAAPPYENTMGASVLRNRLREIGHRSWRSDHSHALVVTYAAPCEIAGNILERCCGAGIFIFSGKPDGDDTADAPFARTLIHHNRVTQALLTCNDWGSIETWQGGPCYVYNNISANPGGYWNWAAGPGNHRLGFAYYLDGAFKNYLFNNIAWGANNDPASKYANRTAFYQASPCVLNAFFNNTAYRFLDGSSWSPAGGRQLFLGNIFEDFQNQVFIHGKQKEDEFASYDAYFTNSIAYSRNAFFKTPHAGTFGGLEGAFPQTNFIGFVQGSADAALLASDVGALASASLMRNPAAGNLRPSPNAMPEAARAVRFFIPWSLAQTVGEWHFRRDNADPSTILDEHWWMTPDYDNRHTYKDRPRADLKGNATANDYEHGPLEDWVPGALRVGPSVTLTATLPVPAPPNAGPAPVYVVSSPAAWFEVSHPPAFIPDAQTNIFVTLKGDLAAMNGKQLQCDLHWHNSGGYAGYNTGFYWPQIFINGPGPYAIPLTPDGKGGVATGFQILIAVAGVHGYTAGGVIPVAVPAEAGRSPTGLVVELVAKFAAGAQGAVLSSAGLSLALDASGGFVFSLGGASATSVAPVANGEWRHILCEYTGHDAPTPELRVYIDGVLAGTAPCGVEYPLPPNGVLTVGGGAEGVLEFLRIALSSLAQSRTDIQELRAWQFDGPHLRDFKGRRLNPGRPAGALDYPNPASLLLVK